MRISPFSLWSLISKTFKIIADMDAPVEPVLQKEMEWKIYY